MAKMLISCVKKDTWVVAVDSAVIQDEWDAFQFSHLKEPRNKNERLCCGYTLSNSATLKTFISIMLLCATGLNLLS